MNLDRAVSLLKKLPIRDFYSQRAVPFIPYDSQLRLINAMKEQQARRRPVRAIVLKSRRQGISTLVDCLFTLDCQAAPAVNGQIVTHNYKSSQALFKAPHMLLEEAVSGRQSLKGLLNLPPLTQHKITFPHKDGDSVLSIATAGNAEGGRGMAITNLHLSELAFYQSVATFAALLPTVPRSPDTMIIIESTANGRAGIGESFYEFWQATVQGQTDFVPVFLSWLEDPNNVDHSTTLTDAPIDEDEKELLAGTFVNGRVIKASMAQLAWRRATISSPICRGYSDIFDQEYPKTPEVAFVSSSEPLFLKEEMSAARRDLEKPVCRGMFSVDGNHVRFDTAQDGPFFLWEKPIQNHRYYIGVDPARGKEEGDFAAIVVLNGTTGHQAMRYAARIDPERLSHFCHCVGHYYNKGMLTIELTGNLGLWVQVRLRDFYRYPNIYRWKGTRDDKMRPPKSAALGWETTYRSREMAMEAYRACLRHNIIHVHDEEVIRQMALASRKELWERWEVKYGHDDILMAMIIANIARHQWHPRALDGASSGITTDADGNKAVEKYAPIQTYETCDTMTALAFHSIMKSKRQFDDKVKKGGLR